jgi:hypothetical protein
MIEEERMPAAFVLNLMYSAFEALFTLRCRTIL